MILSAKVGGGGRVRRGDMGMVLVQSMPRKRLGKQGMVKRLPNYTTTVNISKITTQRGKGSIDFHNDLSVSGVG